MVIKNNRNISLIVFLLIVAGFVLLEHYFPSHISYNLYETITAQYLNSVGVFLQEGLQNIGFNAYLNGSNSLKSEVYSNFPVFHMFFGAVLIENGVLEYSFSSFQVVTGAVMIASYILLISIVIKVSYNVSSALVLSLLILSNNFLIDLYNDLWWEPYFLFLIVSQIYSIVSKKWTLLYFLAFLQFFFNYDSAVYVFTFLIGYFLIHGLGDSFKKAKFASINFQKEDLQVVVKYFVTACISFFITVVVKNIYSAGTPSSEVILLNMYSLSMEDLYRFANYYLLSPYMMSAIVLFIVLAKKSLNYGVVLLVAWSLIWLLIFPAHGLHHSYHYSKVLLLVLYFLISIFIVNSNKCILYVSILVSINLFTGYYLHKFEALDYSGYQNAIPYVGGGDKIVISNHMSYPMTYYMNRSLVIKDEDDINSECLFDYAVVVNDFSQVAVGATVIYRTFNKINALFGSILPELSIYLNKRDKFISSRDRFVSSLEACGGEIVYHDHGLKYSVYIKVEL